MHGHDTLNQWLAILGRRLSSRRVAPLFVLLSQSWLSVAFAESKTCIEAQAAATKAEEAGQLQTALQHLNSCIADATCEPAVVTDCRSMLESLDARMQEGEKPIDYQGELSEAAPVAVPASANAENAASVTPSPTRRNALELRAPSLPLGFWIATGSAAASFGIGATFALIGNSEASHISNCSSNPCDGARHRLKRDYMMADVGFAASALSVGIATWLWMSAQSVTTSEPNLKTVRSSNTVSRLIPSCWITPHSTSLSWSSFF